MTQPLPPDHAEQDLAEETDDAVPTRGYELLPVVGLGGSAGAIRALKTFFETMSAESGLAFVVVLHLSAEHESTLAELLQRSTAMPVIQVQGRTRVEPDTVYVIPPRKALRTTDGYLDLIELPQDSRRRHVAVDVFFRTLADTHGPHAIAVVLSGLDSDGAIGIKRIKERGGLTIAQDPSECEHGGMPRAAIETGMVDWVLPVRDMPGRLLDYTRIEGRLRLPAELPPPAEAEPQPPAASDEASLRDVLTFLRTRTARDFSCYKRATILRRIRRRMQVNGVEDLDAYLAYLRTRPGEAGALLQDLLITVTNFFRDSDCFAALEQALPRIFERKTSSDTLRVWVPACATGEEAYSIAMLMTEHARTLEAAPQVQIFATDLDEEAIRTARDGVYPTTIEADVSEERLRRFFIKEHNAYRIRREIREMVLFAVHDVLKDSPFSRCDLISCRNLLIYLNREPQRRVLDTFHFALNPGGLLFLGSSEAIDDDSQQFSVVDKKHRIYAQRSSPRAGLPVPSGPGTLALALEAQQVTRAGPVIAGASFNAQAPRPAATFEGYAASWRAPFQAAGADRAALAPGRCRARDRPPLAGRGTLPSVRGRRAEQQPPPRDPPEPSHRAARGALSGFAERHVDRRGAARARPRRRAAAGRHERAADGRHRARPLHRDPAPDRGVGEEAEGTARREHGAPERSRRASPRPRARALEVAPSRHRRAVRGVDRGAQGEQ